MRRNLSRHPHHDSYRCYCASGFILGKSVPLPPLEPRGVEKAEAHIARGRQIYYAAHRKSLRPYKPRAQVLW